MNRIAKRVVRSLLASALTVHAYSGIAQAQTAIADTGAFFVGGHVVEINNAVSYVRATGKQAAIAGSAYVEYFLPSKDGTKKPPLVLFPGLGLSGSFFLMKPPGGENWVNHFVRLGYPVYIFHRPGEGAAGFFSDDVNGAIMGKRVEGLQPISRAGDISHAGASRPGTLDGFYDDQQFPKDPEFAAQALAANMPQASPGPASEKYSGSAAMRNEGGPLNVGPGSARYDGGARALIALLEKIGPSIVLGHSLAGPTVLNTAAARPELFRLVIGLEPAGCPPTIAAQIKSVPFLFMEGTRSAEFYKDDPQRLERTRQVNAQCRALGADMGKLGGRSEFIVLGDKGEIGNSHYLMVDANNLRVANLIHDAIEKLLP